MLCVTVCILIALGRSLGVGAVLEGKRENGRERVFEGGEGGNASEVVQEDQVGNFHWRIFKRSPMAQGADKITNDKKPSAFGKIISALSIYHSSKSFTSAKPPAMSGNGSEARIPVVMSSGNGLEITNLTKGVNITRIVGPDGEEIKTFTLPNVENQNNKVSESTDRSEVVDFLVNKPPLMPCNSTAKDSYNKTDSGKSQSMLLTILKIKFKSSEPTSTANVFKNGEPLGGQISLSGNPNAAFNSKDQKRKSSSQLTMTTSALKNVGKTDSRLENKRKGYFRLSSSKTNKSSIPVMKKNSKNKLTTPSSKDILKHKNNFLSDGIESTTLLDRTESKGTTPKIKKSKKGHPRLSYFLYKPKESSTLSGSTCAKSKDKSVMSTSPRMRFFSKLGDRRKPLKGTTIGFDIKTEKNIDFLTGKEPASSALPSTAQNDSPSSPTTEREAQPNIFKDDLYPFHSAGHSNMLHLTTDNSKINIVGKIFSTDINSFLGQTTSMHTECDVAFPLKTKFKYTTSLIKFWEPMNIQSGTSPSKLFDSHDKIWLTTPGVKYFETFARKMSSTPALPPVESIEKQLTTPLNFLESSDQLSLTTSDVIFLDNFYNKSFNQESESTTEGLLERSDEELITPLNFLDSFDQLNLTTSDLIFFDNFNNKSFIQELEATTGLLEGSDEEIISSDCSKAINKPIEFDVFTPTSIEIKLKQFETVNPSETENEFGSWIMNAADIEGVTNKSTNSINQMNLDSFGNSISFGDKTKQQSKNENKNYETHSEYVEQYDINVAKTEFASDFDTVFTPSSVFSVTETQFLQPNINIPIQIEPSTGANVFKPFDNFNVNLDDPSSTKKNTSKWEFNSEDDPGAKNKTGHSIIHSFDEKLKKLSHFHHYSSSTSEKLDLDYEINTKYFTPLTPTVNSHLKWSNSLTTSKGGFRVLPNRTVLNDFPNEDSVTKYYYKNPTENYLLEALITGELHHRTTPMMSDEFVQLYNKSKTSFFKGPISFPDSKNFTALEFEDSTKKRPKYPNRKIGIGMMFKTHTTLDGQREPSTDSVFANIHPLIKTNFLIDKTGNQGEEGSEDHKKTNDLKTKLGLFLPLNTSTILLINNDTRCINIYDHSSTGKGELTKRIGGESFCLIGEPVNEKFISTTGTAHLKTFDDKKKLNPIPKLVKERYKFLSRESLKKNENYTYSGQGGNKNISSLYMLNDYKNHLNVSYGQYDIHGQSTVNTSGQSTEIPGKTSVLDYFTTNNYYSVVNTSSDASVNKMINLAAVKPTEKTTFFNIKSSTIALIGSTEVLEDVGLSTLGPAKNNTSFLESKSSTVSHIGNISITADSESHSTVMMNGDQSSTTFNSINVQEVSSESWADKTTKLADKSFSAGNVEQSSLKDKVVSEHSSSTVGHHFAVTQPSASLFDKLVSLGENIVEKEITEILSEIESCTQAENSMHLGVSLSTKNVEDKISIHKQTSENIHSWSTEAFTVFKASDADSEVTDKTEIYNEKSYSTNPSGVKSSNQSLIKSTTEIDSSSFTQNVSEYSSKPKESTFTEHQTDESNTESSTLSGTESNFLRLTGNNERAFSELKSWTEPLLESISCPNILYSTDKSQGFSCVRDECLTLASIENCTHLAGVLNMRGKADGPMSDSKTSSIPFRENAEVQTLSVETENMNTCTNVQDEMTGATIFSQKCTQCSQDISSTEKLKEPEENQSMGHSSPEMHLPSQGESLVQNQKDIEESKGNGNERSTIKASTALLSRNNIDLRSRIAPVTEHLKELVTSIRENIRSLAYGSTTQSFDSSSNAPLLDKVTGTPSLDKVTGAPSVDKVNHIVLDTFESREGEILKLIGSTVPISGSTEVEQISLVVENSAPQEEVHQTLVQSSIESYSNVTSYIADEDKLNLSTSALKESAGSTEEMESIDHKNIISYVVSGTLLSDSTSENMNFSSFATASESINTVPIYESESDSVAVTSLTTQNLKEHVNVKEITEEPICSTECHSIYFDEPNSTIAGEEYKSTLLLAATETSQTVNDESVASIANELQATSFVYNVTKIKQEKNTVQNTFDENDTSTNECGETIHSPIEKKEKDEASCEFTTEKNENSTIQSDKLRQNSVTYRTTFGTKLSTQVYESMPLSSRVSQKYNENMTQFNKNSSITSDVKKSFPSNTFLLKSEDQNVTSFNESSTESAYVQWQLSTIISGSEILQKPTENIAVTTENVAEAYTVPNEEVISTTEQPVILSNDVSDQSLLRSDEFVGFDLCNGKRTINSEKKEGVVLLHENSKNGDSGSLVEESQDLPVNAFFESLIPNEVVQNNIAESDSNLNGSAFLKGVANGNCDFDYPLNFLNQQNVLISGYIIPSRNTTFIPEIDMVSDGDTNNLKCSTNMFPLETILLSNMFDDDMRREDGGGKAEDSERKGALAYTTPAFSLDVPVLVPVLSVDPRKRLKVEQTTNENSIDEKQSFPNNTKVASYRRKYSHESTPEKFIKIYYKFPPPKPSFEKSVMGNIINFITHDCALGQDVIYNTNREECRKVTDQNFVSSTSPLLPESVFMHKPAGKIESNEKTNRNSCANTIDQRKLFFNDSQAAILTENKKIKTNDFTGCSNESRYNYTENLTGNVIKTHLTSDNKISNSNVLFTEYLRKQKKSNIPEIDKAKRYVDKPQSPMHYFLEKPPGIIDILQFLAMDGNDTLLPFCPKGSFNADKIQLLNMLASESANTVTSSNKDIDKISLSDSSNFETVNLSKGLLPNGTFTSTKPLTNNRSRILELNDSIEKLPYSVLKNVLYQNGDMNISKNEFKRRDDHLNEGLLLNKIKQKLIANKVESLYSNLENRYKCAGDSKKNSKEMNTNEDMYKLVGDFMSLLRTDGTKNLSKLTKKSNSTKDKQESLVERFKPLLLHLFLNDKPIKLNQEENPQEDKLAELTQNLNNSNISSRFVGESRKCFGLGKPRSPVTRCPCEEEFRNKNCPIPTTPCLKCPKTKASCLLGVSVDGEVELTEATSSASDEDLTGSTSGFTFDEPSGEGTSFYSVVTNTEEITTFVEESSTAKGNVEDKIQQVKINPDDLITRNVSCRISKGPVNSSLIALLNPAISDGLRDKGLKVCPSNDTNQKSGVTSQGKLFIKSQPGPANLLFELSQSAPGSFSNSKLPLTPLFNFSNSQFSLIQDDRIQKLLNSTYAHFNSLPLNIVMDNKNLSGLLYVTENGLNSAPKYFTNDSNIPVIIEQHLNVKANLLHPLKHNVSQYPQHLISHENVYSTHDSLQNNLSALIQSLAGHPISIIGKGSPGSERNLDDALKQTGIQHLFSSLSIPINLFNPNDFPSVNDAVTCLSFVSQISKNNLTYFPIKNLTFSTPNDTGVIRSLISNEIVTNCSLKNKIKKPSNESSIGNAEPDVTIELYLNKTPSVKIIGGTSTHKISYQSKYNLPEVITESHTNEQQKSERATELFKEKIRIPAVVTEVQLDKSKWSDITTEYVSLKTEKPETDTEDFVRICQVSNKESFDPKDNVANARKTISRTGLNMTVHLESKGIARRTNSSEISEKSPRDINIIQGNEKNVSNVPLSVSNQTAALLKITEGNSCEMSKRNIFDSKGLNKNRAMFYHTLLTRKVGPTFVDDTSQDNFYNDYVNNEKNYGFVSATENKESLVGNTNKGKDSSDRLIRGANSNKKFVSNCCREPPLDPKDWDTACFKPLVPRLPNFWVAPLNGSEKSDRPVDRGKTMKNYPAWLKMGRGEDSAPEIPLRPNLITDRFQMKDPNVKHHEQVSGIYGRWSKSKGKNGTKSNHLTAGAKGLIDIRLDQDIKDNKANGVSGSLKSFLEQMNDRTQSTEKGVSESEERLQVGHTVCVPPDMVEERHTIYPIYPLYPVAPPFNPITPSKKAHEQ